MERRYDSAALRGRTRYGDQLY